MSSSSDSGSSTSALINYIRSGETCQSAGSISDQEYNFLDFLGVAQSLKIDFLPITWQPALGKIGEGGTAKIYQALINVQASFTFKRLKSPQSTLEESRNWRALIAEISILGHPAIRIHSNIVRIEGICWDVVDSGEEVWPVLVFEKTSYGDLNYFMTSGPGKELDWTDRLEMLFDIALTVRDLHVIDIVHGDIKPENILIFKKDDGRYVAKIMDFGYSTLFATEDDLIQIPYSGIWTAPERHHRGILPIQAKKMDGYSFGVLCLWLLFYNKADREFEPKKDVGNSPTCLSIYAFELLRSAADLDTRGRNRIQKVLRSTLAQNPVERTADFNELLELLSPYSSVSSGYQREVKTMCLASPVDRIFIPPGDFQIAPSLHQLIRAHYGVRYHIVKCLEERRDQFPASRCHTLDLALCYELGLGVQRDVVEYSRVLLTTDGISLKDVQDLEDVIEKIKQSSEPPEFQDGIFKNLLEQGHLIEFDLSIQYREEQHSREAESRYRREVESIGIALGEDHSLVQTLRVQLSLLMTSEGRWKDAEEIQIRVVELENKKEGGVSTQYMSSLASTYIDLGRWKEAENIQKKVVEIRKKVFGPEHTRTLQSLATLALTYQHQGQLQEAEELEIQILDSMQRVYGKGHPLTLASISSLATTYSQQKRWKEADRLKRRVLKRIKKVRGREHPDTINSISNLATVYSDQERWQEAEELELKAIKLSKRVLGAEHPHTLASMRHLATIYSAAEKWQDAEALGLQIFKTTKRLLGAEHPDTLSMTSDLATVYSATKRLPEAAVLASQNIETSKKILGPEHPETLVTMSNLALIYCNQEWCESDELKMQERWTKAEQLAVHVVETRKRVLGAIHPDTLKGMDLLAYVYTMQGRLGLAQEFLAYMDNVASTLRKQWGSTAAEELLANMNNVVKVYKVRIHYEEVEESEIHVLEMRD